MEYTKEITDTGLSKEQAIVYEILLRAGESPARNIASLVSKEASLSRPMVYKLLEELIELDLVDKFDEPGKVAKFAPKHPVAINKMIDEKKKNIEYVKRQFTTTSGKLSSLFNMSVGRPGVEFYEGEDGVWEVLMDSLNATEEILTYADLKAVQKKPELNIEYAALREHHGVKKRGLVIDSPEARKFLSSYKGEVTKTKLISAKEKMPPFQTTMQIYDNKISYITDTDDYFVGIIITDQHIANTHKYLFESLWRLSGGEVL